MRMKTRRQRELGQVTKLTKLASVKYWRSIGTPIADEQGRLLVTFAKQEVRWKKHFNKVLNRTPPTENADVQDTDIDLDDVITPLEIQDIMTAIRSLKKEGLMVKTGLNAVVF